MEAPYLARCSDDKTATKVRPREYALKFPYMQVNRPGMVSWLIFDLDHPNAWIWEDAGLPAPNLIVRNRNTGTSHLYYAIPPVCTTERGRSKPIEYMKAVYLEMASRLRADPNYASGPVAKTPGHPWWLTTELHASVYELGKLADYVDLPQPLRIGARTARNHEPHSRHCQLFEVLRHYAYSIVNKQKETGSYELFVSHLEAYSLNVMSRVVQAAGSGEGDLPWSSVRATVRSVARWTWEHYRGAGDVNRGVMQLDEHLPIHERQRRAAARTTSIRRQATESKVRSAAQELLAKGQSLAQAAVARLAGITRQTMASYRYVLDELLKPAVVNLAEASKTSAKPVKFGVHQVAAAPVQPGVFVRNSPFFDSGVSDLPEPAS